MCLFIKRIFLIVCLTITTPSFADGQVTVMPYPAHIVTEEGSYAAPDTLRVAPGILNKAQQNTLSGLLDSISLDHLFTHSGQADISVESVSVGETMPKLGQDESYRLEISTTGIRISAEGFWGVHYGFQTLRQLYNRDSRTFPLVVVEDTPRFPWRGLLIDSVRHFIPVDAIKRQIDGMASAKLNVFHWHLTDDQGWRIPIDGYPRLHENASDGRFYSHTQIRDVIDYAAARGIRVVPEVDFPGHASAIAVAYPNLMSAPGPYEMERQWGVFKPLLNPANPKVFEFIDAVFAQLHRLFPDAYVHIGGDEVETHQWQHNADIKNFMKDRGLSGYQELHTEFNHNLQAMLKKYDRHMMGWDEILHPKLDKDVVIQSWRGLHSLKGIVDGGFKGLLSNGFYIDQPQYADYHYRNDPLGPALGEQPATEDVMGIGSWRKVELEMPRLKGLPVAITLWLPSKSPELAIVRFNNLPNRWARKVTHKDNVTSVSIDAWMGPVTLSFTADTDSTHLAMIGNAPYPLRPLSTTEVANPEQIAAQLPNGYSPEPGQILGGEATLWSELVDENNIDRRTWPRLYVIAERLWSPAFVCDEENMYQRLWKMDNFAADVVGLAHQNQLYKALERMSKGKAPVVALLTLTEMLEPAHYYTRHHIHFQQGLYHQQVPLDTLADILPVQSRAMHTLDERVSALNEKETFVDAKRAIEAQLRGYQEAINAVSLHAPEDFKTLLPELRNYVEHGLSTLNNCNSSLKQQTKSNGIPQSQSEIVLAIAPRIQKLVARCGNPPD